ncbi:DUF6493 family protein [Nonomuraea sp. MTCD27]|uniref:DUF7825 domain-containing protein n=1 Tax=Nonomuraea sp. MTCD27 TaxID=1676747 RepID=UPI0035C14E9E
MNAWQDLLKLVKAGDVPGTIRFATELDAAGRKAVAAELPAYVTREFRATSWMEWAGQVSPLLLAGTACLSGAAAVTAWLFRREFRWGSQGESGRILELLRRRPVAWQADVARRIAARSRLPELRHWVVAAELVRGTGIEPPDDDAFKVGWLRTLRPSTAEGDPLFTAYGRRLFEIDGLSQTALWQVVEVVVRLVENGLLDRAAVIDGLVGRLLRDGPGARVELAGLHDRLDLDIDESAARARDYARLLPAGPVAVADLALAQLRRLEEAGRLEEELFAEAVAALAFRPEKKLLRTALSWAGDAVLREAGRVDAVLAAVSMIFAQDTPALRERAVRLAVKLAPQAGRAGREAVRQAAAELDGEQREKVSAAYGGGLAEARTPVATPLAAVRGPSLPPPVTSPQELARELAAFGRSPDVYAYERLLAGLAEWSHRAPDALREALRPWWHPFDPHTYGHYGSEIHEGLREAVNRAFLAFASPEHSGTLTRGAHKRRRPAAPGAFDRLYLRRALELVTPFETGTGYPVLLATPTSGTGHLDPPALLDRLERQEAEGVPALPADLAQALLRLPRHFSPSEIERAGRLTSGAGRACAAWMRAGGLTDPDVTVSVRRHQGYGGSVWHDLHAEFTPPTIPSAIPSAAPPTDAPTTAAVSATVATAPYPGPSAAAPASPAGLHEELRDLFEVRSGHTYTLTWWPLVMPAHREVVAAHLACYLPSSMDANDRQTQALAALAHGDGPLGPATAYALACGMGHANPAERAAATDAFLTLAARGEVPAQALGEAVTDLVESEFVKLNRVLSVLDDATQARAQEAVWAVVVRVLPGLLPKDGERPRAGVADLLATGTRAARIAGVRVDVPEVAAVAGRRGSSRLVLEARRLMQLIGSP